MTTSFKLRSAVTVLSLASAITFSSCQKEELMEEQFSDATPLEANEMDQQIDGQYIVVFKDGGKLNRVSTEALSAAGAKTVSSLRQHTLERTHIHAEDVVENFDGIVNGFAARLSNEQLTALRKNPDVAYIENDRYIALPFSKTKDFISKDRGTTRGGAGSSTDPAPTGPVDSSPAAYTKIKPLTGEYIPWNIERVGYGDGTGKTVWIIDSGVDTKHPDLNVDLSRSASFIYGIQTIEDGYGHGTAVAGIVGAKNNGSGMIGVAANATIVALRIFDDEGKGTVSRAISAVNYASLYAKPGEVINMSLGSGISTTLDNAVKSAAAKGILFALAAGNTGVDCAGTSPARVNAPGVYTVSAMDAYNRLWDLSNYGTTVDFAAPGVNVTVTTKGGNIGSGGKGTSFAAPHVAGILLLRGTVYSQGTITGDKDDMPDPIASLN